MTSEVDNESQNRQPGFEIQEPNPIMRNFAEICQHHAEKVEYLCETCNELACESCFFNGPHATPVHLGRALHVIKKERQEKLKNNVNMNLRRLEVDYIEKLRKCDRAYIHSIYLSKLIADKSRVFFESLVSKSQERFLEKLSWINKVHSELQGDVSKMSKIVVESNYLVKNNRVAEFLLRYKTLFRETEFLTIKKYHCKLFS